MIPYGVYKIVHLVGIMMIFLSLGAVVMRSIVGEPATAAFRRQVAITHGSGLLLALIGGFGALARMGMSSLPGWIYGKLVIWFVLAAALGIAARQRSLGRPLWFLSVVLGAIAAYLAVYKPF